MPIPSLSICAPMPRCRRARRCRQRAARAPADAMIVLLKRPMISHAAHLMPYADMLILYYIRCSALMLASPRLTMLCALRVRRAAPVPPYHATRMALLDYAATRQASPPHVIDAGAARYAGAIIFDTRAAIRQQMLLCLLILIDATLPPC